MENSETYFTCQYRPWIKGLFWHRNANLRLLLHSGVTSDFAAVTAGEQGLIPGCASPIDLLAILQESLDRAIFLYIFIHEIRLSGVRASISIVHIRKFYKM